MCEGVDPAGGFEPQVTRAVAGDSLVDGCRAGVSAIKVTWNPKVDKGSYVLRPRVRPHHRQPPRLRRRVGRSERSTRRLTGYWNYSNINQNGDPSAAW